LVGALIVFCTALRRALSIRRVRARERQIGGVAITPDWPNRRRFWKFVAYYALVVCTVFPFSREVLPYWLHEYMEFASILATFPTSFSYETWSAPLHITYADPVLPPGVPRLLLYLGFAAMAVINAVLARYIVLTVRWVWPPYGRRRRGG
jgi:hypothetical protein